MNALLFAFAVSLPQEPAVALPPDLPALVARIEAAHRPHGPVPPITAFVSKLEMHVLGAEAPANVQVDLAVEFLEWLQPERNRTQTLIRYKILEAGAPIVRGRDKDGPWQFFQGEAKDLRGAEFTQDLEAYQKHANLARQLVRFLDPGAVLRSLEQPGAVRVADWGIGRVPKTACHVVEGELPAFPLLRQGGDDARAHVRIYVTAAEGRLLAVEARPLVDGKPDDSRLELVRLLDLYEQDDLLVPRKLEHLWRTADGSLRLQSRAVLTTLSLRPELRAEDFDRKKM